MTREPLPRDVQRKLLEVLSRGRAVGATFEWAWGAAVPAALRLRSVVVRHELREHIAQRRAIYEAIYEKDRVPKGEPPDTRSRPRARER